MSVTNTVLNRTVLVMTLIAVSHCINKPTCLGIRMVSFTKFILASLLLLSSVCASAAGTLMMKADPASEVFVVVLPANPTTGYQWTVTAYDKKLFKMTNSRYIAPQTKLIGAGGKMTFTFERLKGQSYPQSTAMTFTYARSWEPKSAMLQPVTVQFTK